MGIFDFADGLKKDLGELVDGATDVVGDQLDHLGLDGAGQAVKNFGDTVANSLGAMPDEKQLGDTEDPKELILGDPDAIRGHATTISGFGTNFSSAGAGLKGMSAGHWTGKGSEGYEQATAREWPKWTTAADAATSAAGALNTWAGDVEFAQGMAAEAIRLWNEAERKGAEWVADANRKIAAYNRDVDDFNNGDSMTVPVKPVLGTNPEKALKEEAERVLQVGRDHRNNAASGIKGTLEGAANMAPPMPSTMDQITGDAEDLHEAGSVAGNHFTAGAVTAVTETVKMIRTVDPTNPYNIANPGQYIQNVARVGAGVTHQIAHPAEFVRGFIGSGWSSDPAQSAGTLAANLGMAVAPGPKGVGGLSAATKVVREIPEVRALKDVVPSMSRGAKVGDHGIGAVENGGGTGSRTAGGLHPSGEATGGGARALPTEHGGSVQPVATQHHSPAPPASGPHGGTGGDPARAEASTSSVGGTSGGGTHAGAPEHGTSASDPGGPGSGPHRTESVAPEPSSPTTAPYPASDHAGPDYAASDHGGSSDRSVSTDHSGSTEQPASSDHSGGRDPDPAPDRDPDGERSTPAESTPGGQAHGQQSDGGPHDGPPQAGQSDGQPVGGQPHDGQAEPVGRHDDADTDQSDPSPVQHDSDGQPSPVRHDESPAAPRDEPATQPAGSSAPHEPVTPRSPESSPGSGTRVDDGVSPRTNHDPGTAPRDAGTPPRDVPPVTREPMQQPVVAPASHPSPPSPLSSSPLSSSASSSPAAGPHPAPKPDAPFAPRTDLVRNDAAPNAVRDAPAANRVDDATGSRPSTVGRGGVDSTPDLGQRTTAPPAHRPADGTPPPRGVDSSPVKAESDGGPKAVARRPGEDGAALVMNSADARATSGLHPGDGGGRAPGTGTSGGGGHGGHGTDHGGHRNDGAAGDKPNGETGAQHHPGDTGQTNNGTREQAEQPGGNEEPRHCTKDGEPVNVATGEYFLPMTDVELPGVLPLRLTHQHRSRYQWGMWFGPTAVGTFDARIILDADGVTSVDADGTMLRFAHPQPDSPVRQIQGADWELSLTGTGGYRLRRLDTDLSHYFEPKPHLHGADRDAGVIAISAIMDRHLNRILFSYDENGWPTAVEHSAGYRVAVTTDGARVLGYRLVAGVDGVPVDQQLRDFEYHDGHLAAVRNSVGATTYFRHDDAGRMVSWIDSLGQEYWNRYDALGRVVQQSGVDGVWAGTFRYREFADGTGGLTMYTDAAGGVTTYGIDADGRIRREIDPMGRETATDFNASRDPLRRVDPVGATTTYQYTDVGDVASVTDPSGAITRIDYGAPHRPSVVIAADGARTSYSYDEYGNVASAVDNAGVTTVFTHAGTGAVASVADADGVVTRYETNAAGLPTRIVDAFGGVTEVSYDPFGRMVGVVDAEGNATAVGYDPEGRRTSSTDASGAVQRWTYDGEGNCLAHVDALGAVTRWEYGYFDLPVARIDADGSRTLFAYDAARRLISVTNAAGLVWHYEYNLDGTLATESDFNGVTTAYTYDAAGRLASRRNAAGQSVLFTYDACGRVIREVSVADDDVTMSGGDAVGDESIGYVYDVVGRLVSTQGDYGTWRAEYGGTGSPSSFTLGESRIDIGWTPAGQLATVVAPSGMRTDYAYDMRGLLESVTAAGRPCEFSTDRAGREIRRRFGGAAIDSVWDPVGRLTGRSIVANPVDPSALSLGTTVAAAESSMETASFAYRADGALMSSSGPSGRTTYGLDALGRVTDREAAGVRESYRFDQSGNLSAAAGDATPNGRGWVFRGTLLVEDGRSSYRYDAAGRVVSVVTKRLSRRPDVWRYRWDAWDRLREITVPDGSVFAYSYDHAGRRVAKTNTATGVVTRFGWLGDQLIEQSVIGADGVVGETVSWGYVPGGLVPLAQVHSSGVDVGEVGGGPVSVVDTGVLNLGPGAGSGVGGRSRLFVADSSWVDREFFAIVADQVLSPMVLVDPVSAEVVGRASSSLWGAVSWSGVSTPWRFPGQYCDEESGLHYNRFRYYSPGSGRFVSPDPLGLSPAPNPYGYPGNPTVVCDPLGLAPLEAYQVLDPNTIRFSQGTVNDAVALTEKMRLEGWNGPPIDVVRMEDGSLTTIDNTRVLAARQAGIDVHAVVHARSDPIESAAVAERLKSRKGALPATWLDAVEYRIGRQNGSFRRANPFGSLEPPRNSNGR